MKRFRLWCTAILAAVAFVALGPDQLAPLRTPLDAERPHPEQIRLLDELASWTGEARQGAPGPFPSDESLTDSVSSRSDSFALFVETDHGLAHMVLADLPFRDEIESAARRYRVDALLVAAVIEAESSFDPSATSESGALGLMQVMPGTASELGTEDALDPAQNVEAGARYLRGLLRQFNGDLPLALAAYNAGPAAVIRYGGIPPYTETTRYVERVLRRYVDHRQAVWQAATAGGILSGS